MATASVVLLYVAGAVIVYWHVWSGSPSHDTQFGPDTALNTWFLAWAPQALFHGLNPFFSHAGNSPYGINVLANTSELLLGVLATPITKVFGPIATFNFLMTAALAGSATSGYFLARRFTTWRPAAFAGGLLFGFSPYMIAASVGAHLHLTFLVFPPLILLVLHELLVRQSWSLRRCGLTLAGLVIAQFFVSVEVLVITALTAAVALVVTAIVGRSEIRERVGYAWRGALLALAVTAVVLIYPIWLLDKGPGHIVGPIQLEPEAYRADLFGAFIPDALQKLAPMRATTLSAHFANSLVENGSYLGIPLVVILVLGAVWLRRRAVTWVVAVSAIGVFVLSLGGALAVLHAPATNAHGSAIGRIALPEVILAKLPVLSNTIPARFSGFVALFAGLLLAIILDALHRKWHGNPRRWAFPMLVALVCFVPLIPAVPIGSIEPVVVPPFFAGQAVTALKPASTTLVLPYPSEWYPQDQLWQIEGSHPYRFNLPAGYFLVAQTNEGSRLAFTPTIPYTRDSLTAEVFIGLGRGQVPRETAALKGRLHAQFRSWQVTSAVVPLAFTPNAALTVTFLTWLLGKPTATDVSGATVWYRV